MKAFEKNDDFAIYVDGEYLMRAHCSYGEVFDLIWAIHCEYPSANIEICVVGPDDLYNE